MPKKKAKGDIQLYLLPPISFDGPRDKTTKPFASVSILDPVITIERHHGKYHVAARFNMETTILNYYENQKRDGHEYFFQDIRLQYWSSRPDEMLSMKPESDPSAALTVTRGTETKLSVGAEISLSETPSANVSLGLDRTRTLTVEYALSTWSLSAHRIIMPKTTEALSSRLPAGSKKKPPESGAKEQPVFQWFWAGTHRQTETLTPDLKYTVKRHVVAKRIIPIESFPSLREEKMEEEEPDETKEVSNNGPETTGVQDAPPPREEAKKTKSSEKAPRLNTLENLLQFTFHVEVRVRKRFGRFQRLIRLSGNQVKGKLLKPSCQQGFTLRAIPNRKGVPTDDTPDINALLNSIKNEYDGRWDELGDLDFFGLAGALKEVQVETERETERETLLDLERLREQETQTERG
ncbi:hypothetical protein QBC47DRAFT_392424 [Echria macrotheca]|uniref:Uncharacterized protein n=1 Tax=Echria macrotheca TaxID=438768 RepID=A0AAJ0F7H9_9PEZI|nr:hypothetical protein QBC47DRAFT_392424 [Echria macrotheca]